MINMHSSACVAGETVSAVYTQVSLAGIYIVVSVQPSKKKKKKKEEKKKKDLRLRSSSFVAEK